MNIGLASVWWTLEARRGYLALSRACRAPHPAPGITHPASRFNSPPMNPPAGGARRSRRFNFLYCKNLSHRNGVKLFKCGIWIAACGFKEAAEGAGGGVQDEQAASMRDIIGAVEPR